MTGVCARVGRGDWYRYHHLFRELLLVELASTSPEIVRELHALAAEWFYANGYIEDTLSHAAEVGEHELSRLLAAEHLNLIRTGRIDLLMRYLDQLSDAELERRPVAAAAGAIVAGSQGEPTAKRRRLEQLADENRADLPDTDQRYVEVVVTLSRASFLDQPLDFTLENATRCVELARSDVPDLLVIALAVFGYASYLRGDSATALEAVDEAVALPGAPRQLHGFIYAQSLRSLLESDLGHPQTAEADARATVGEARQLGLAGTWSAGFAHHALGQALLQLGRPQEAERELERAEVLRCARDRRLDHAHTLLALAMARIARGRLTIAETEFDAAREHLDAFSGAARLERLAEDVERGLDESRAGSPKPVEQPTLAELAVLRLLATDLSQREIGSELFLSMNTIKTHTRHLYGKLGVSSRDAAVHRASVLGLIGSGESPG